MKLINSLALATATLCALTAGGKGVSDTGTVVCKDMPQPGCAR